MSSVLTRVLLERRGYHVGLGILNPPEDDKWWDGDFSHFKIIFNEIANSVPKTMTDRSLKKTNPIITSTNGSDTVSTKFNDWVCLFE